MAIRITCDKCGLEISSEDVRYAEMYKYDLDDKKVPIMQKKEVCVMCAEKIKDKI